MDNILNLLQMCKMERHSMPIQELCSSSVICCNCRESSNMYFDYLALILCWHILKVCKLYTQMHSTGWTMVGPSPTVSERLQPNYHKAKALPELSVLNN